MKEGDEQFDVKEKNYFKLLKKNHPLSHPLTLF